MNEVLDQKSPVEIANWLLERLGPVPPLRSVLWSQSGGASSSSEFPFEDPGGPLAFRKTAAFVSELSDGQGVS